MWSIFTTKKPPEMSIPKEVTIPDKTEYRGYHSSREGGFIDLKDYKKANLHVTLWPTFTHFRRFASDPRVEGIRLNSAMVNVFEIDDNTFGHLHTDKLWFDIKGMQMRIKEVISDHTTDHLEFILNRPVKVKTPCPVYFKGGEDAAKLIEVRDGTHFIFEGGPKFEVRAGESIHIRNEYEVGGPLLLQNELDKIERIKKYGIKGWYLSYVYEASHEAQLREIIGLDRLILKIEDKRGLEFVANHKFNLESTNLMAARGDLYVEVDYPHDILAACKLIISKDQGAFVGSRMLLSIISNRHSVPSAADFSELAWLYDIGYRNFLLCDELCLKGEWLGAAVNTFDAFRESYCL